MIFMVHYVEDIHQPLHTLTNVKFNIDGDQGGDEFCIKLNKEKRCIQNLHDLWDSAVGYLNPNMNIQQTAHQLQHFYPLESYTNSLRQFDPEQWANENYQYARFIYSLPMITSPSLEYSHKGQAIAKTRLVLAGYRLAALLNSYLK